MKIFVCRTPNIGTYHLTDREILNIKSTISKDGDAILIVNYYDFEDCLNHTIYCDRIDVITKKVEEKIMKYPKTYEECCELLDGCSYNIMFDRCETAYEEFLHNKLLALRKLIICRDAYWKLYGEEMGLGKPWKPDWNTNEPKYVISCTSNGIEKQWETTYCKVLAFPTEEMRDAFYENFKELIEQCKELL